MSIVRKHWALAASFACAISILTTTANARTAQPALSVPVPDATALPSPTMSAAPAHAPANPTVSATPTGSSAPVPQATPRAIGVRFATDARLTYISQTTSGPGVVGPEAAGFVAGSPLAPNTPYDLFSSAPQVSGISGIGELFSSAQYRSKAFDIALRAGLATVHGSPTNALYWGENLLPTLNAHVGAQALPYAVSFPTHPGQDAAVATRLSVLCAAIGTADGALRAHAGWFDLAQTDRFAFAQPALTNLNPAIAYVPAETLSNGVPGLESWQPVASALPLHGVDVVAKSAHATLELSNAALPSLPGESARLSMGSIVLDRGEGTRFSAQVLHAATSGIVFSTTVPFGNAPTFVPYPQGVLPISFLSGQEQTIGGIRGAFHAVPALALDGVIEIGRAWYASALTARPNTAAPGGFYHAGLSQTRGRVTASVDVYRMEPRYATMILPYGIPENQWSVSFAWPGQWLKSNYQLIDNSVLGVNRQGYRLRYFVDRGPFEVHLEYTDLRQIDPETVATSQQTGFIDGYYLPQQPAAATFGRQRRSALWMAWHRSFGDVTLDVVDDTLYRPFVATHSEDAVSYEVPQAVLSYARHVSPAIIGAVGLGRYALKGTFSEPLDFAERLYFAGVEIQQTHRSSLLVTYRRTSASGITTFPQSPASPNFSGSAVIVEQRLRN